MKFTNSRGVLSIPGRGVALRLEGITGEVLPSDLRFKARVVGRPGIFFNPERLFTLDFTLMPQESGMLRAEEVEVYSYEHPRITLRAATPPRVAIVKASPKDAPEPPPPVA